MTTAQIGLMANTGKTMTQRTTVRVRQHRIHYGKYIMVGIFIFAVLALLGALIICCDVPNPHFTQ